MLTKNLMPLSFLVLTQRPGLGTTVKLGYSGAGSKESNSSTWQQCLVTFHDLFLQPPCFGTLTGALGRQERGFPPEGFPPMRQAVNHLSEIDIVYHHQIRINDGWVDIQTCRSKTHSGKFLKVLGKIILKILDNNMLSTCVAAICIDFWPSGLINRKISTCSASILPYT